MADTLRLWQGLLIRRAVEHELAALELQEASICVARGDADGMERLTIADRYFHETHRMMKAAERKLAEMTESFERSTSPTFPNPMPMSGPTIAEMVAAGHLPEYQTVEVGAL